MVSISPRATSSGARAPSSGNQPRLGRVTETLPILSMLHSAESGLINSALNQRLASSRPAPVRFQSSYPPV